MIEKSLLLKESFSATLPSDFDVIPKTLSIDDFLLKTITERWNQANLSYFDSYLNRTYREDEIVSIGKDLYYSNIVFFMQCLQSFVIFRNIIFVKANIATFL